MAMTRTGTVAAPISIIGKDLDAGATMNGDTTPNVGVLKAGTLMKYTAATKTFDKAVVGTDTLAGLLADEVDTGTGGATEILPIMVYRRGVFRRQEIESANNVAITPGSAVDIALNDLGIFLELSYEAYEGLTPVPAGVQPMSALGDIQENETLRKEAEEVDAKAKEAEKTAAQQPQAPAKS
jgi:hypothetical protein